MYAVIPVIMIFSKSSIQVNPRCYKCEVTSYYLRRYTREDLKEMCRIVLRTTGDSDIARMLYADLANGQHPYEKEEYWAGFILAGR